jgi:hypothetical protein
VPLYVFGCSQGHRTEQIVPLGTETSACALCDEQGCGRVYQYSMAITQPEVDLRGMTRRFIEAQGEIATAYERHGLEMPNLAGAGRQRADALRRSGEGFRPLS